MENQIREHNTNKSINGKSINGKTINGKIINGGPMNRTKKEARGVGEGGGNVALVAGQNIVQRDFWRKELGGRWSRGYLSQAPYSADSASPGGAGESVPEPVAQRYPFGLTGDIYDGLMRLSNHSDIRLHMILTAAVLVLVYRYGGPDGTPVGADHDGGRDIMVGTPIYRPDAEGRFVNTVLPLRLSVAPAMTFKDLLLQVRGVLKAAAQCQDYPLDLLAAEMGVSYPPFGTAVVLKNIQEEDHVRHLPVRHLPLGALFSFMRTNGCIEGVLETGAGERVTLHFTRLLGAVLGDVNRELGRIDFLPGDEKRQLLLDLNGGGAGAAPGSPVPDLFVARARQAPVHTALVLREPDARGGRTRHLTYGELDRRTDDLARFLRHRGVGPDRPVAVMHDDSLEMIQGLLAVMKSGGVYLPIDPQYPPHRVTAILEDSNAPLLLTDRTMVGRHSFVVLQGSGRNPVKLIKTAPRAGGGNLDDLQRVDRSLINYDAYAPHPGQAMIKNSLTVQFSRGCVYNCTYCFKIWHGNYRVRSGRNMFEEIQYYHKQGVRRFSFVDDLPNLNVKESREFYRLVIKHIVRKGEPIHLHYVNGIRGDILTTEDIDLMVEAGTVVMDLALETSSPRLQKLIRKNLNLERWRENVDYIINHHPHVVLETALLHGIPTETEAEALASLDYLENLKWIHFPYIHLLKIYPNTGMARVAMDHGVSAAAIDRSADLAYHELPETLPFSADFTRRFQAQFLHEYFLSRERLLAVLPTQMKVFTEDELVRAYRGYLPVDADITDFNRFLAYAGIDPGEITGECLCENFSRVGNFSPPPAAPTVPTAPTAPVQPLKVLLLDLSQFFSHHRTIMYDMVEPPLGLMYLLTHVQRKLGGRVTGKIAKSRTDFDSFDELRALILEYKPQVIGLRTLNFYRDFFHETASMIRQWGIDAPIIAGGPYATCAYTAVLKDRNIDLAILGEGEHTFCEILEHILENNGRLPEEGVLKDIAGIAFAAADSARGNRREVLVPPDPSKIFIKGAPVHGVPPAPNRQEDLAYIIYTSGSSGAPKGVAVRRDNLSNQVRALSHRFNLDHTCRYLLLAPFGFDVSLMHIFLALTTGARLFLVPGEIKKDPHRFWQFVVKSKVNILNMVPDFMSALLEGVGPGVPPFKYLFIGGDTFPSELYRRIRDNVRAEEVINIYGPTETTINATLYSCKSKPVGPVLPIGRPLSGYRAYVLDQHLGPVPTGVPGELFIGGAGVARGYLNKPELTAGRFLDYRCDRTDGQDRVYKTGDRVRRLPGGDLEFLGRLDRQIKVRGFRVEPAEIEAALLNHDAVEKAVVTIRDNAVFAYYVPRVVQRPELWPSIGEYFIWDDLMYYSMTHDHLRNSRFKAAIRQRVRGKTVLDVGTGKDVILARFCVEAGAEKVYAVEILEKYYREARENVRQMGLENKIQVIHGDITRLELPEKVDVCVSNQCGTIGGSEGAVRLHNHIHRFLKKGGHVVPERCVTKIAAAFLPPELHKKPGFGEIPANYVKKIFEVTGFPFDLRLCVKGFPRSNIISNVGIFEDLNFTDIIDESADRRVNLEIDREGRLDGFLLWLNLYALENSGTETGDREHRDRENRGIMMDSLSHQYVWLPVYVPVFYPGLDVVPGDRFEIHCIRTRGVDIAPDYRVRGVLIRRNGKSIPFDYDLARIKQRTGADGSGADGSDPFYRELFSMDHGGESGSPSSRVRAVDLKDYLLRYLPAFMIPGHFVPLERMPLTPGGKVDRSALPAVESGEPMRDFVEPTPGIEEKVADIWAGVLGMARGRISAEANFFDLGGHSLKAALVMGKIHRLLGVRISMAELFRAPTIRGLARFIRGSVKTPFTAVLPTEDREYYPLSPAQKRLYVLYRMKPHITAYNMPHVIPLSPGADRATIRRVFMALLNRHESLRTGFTIINGGAVQRVYAARDLEFDLQEGEMDDLDTILEDFVTPFDLARPPLLRVKIVMKGDKPGLLLVDLHHIITDGISQRLLVREFNRLYRGEELSPPLLQYRDFALWWTGEEQQAALRRQGAWWLRRFEEEPPLVDLPYDYTRPPEQSFEGKTVPFRLGARETGALKQLAAAEDVTLYMLLLTLFSLLPARLAGTEDIVTGTPAAGRRHDDLAPVMGMFVNVLALRTFPHGEKTVRTYLREVKHEVLGAFENQDYPFEGLLEKLAGRISRDLGRNPLFDILFTLDSAHEDTGGEPADGTASDVPGPPAAPDRTARYDLTLAAREAGVELEFAFQYSTRLFKVATIHRFISYFRSLVNAVIDAPGGKIAHIRLLDPAERREMLCRFNATVAVYPHDSFLHHLFEEQVLRTPDRTALVGGHSGKSGSGEWGQLTYRGLDRLSDGLARVLKKGGLGEGGIAAIRMGRRVELIIGLLGILKTGAAYMPIHTDYPPERVDYILNDSGARTLLSDRGPGETIDDIMKQDIMKQVINGNVTENAKEPLNGARPRSGVADTGRALAYVIYTSGSTGSPRGVLIAHRGLVNYVDWRIRFYGFTPRDITLQLLSAAFDGFGGNLYPGLLSGGKVVLARQTRHLEAGALAALIRREGTTNVSLVPGMYDALLQNDPGGALDQVRFVALAGEATEKGLIETSRRDYPGIVLYNEYGPTECTVGVTARRGMTREGAAVIGKPISNASVFIMDKYDQPVPTGVIGEICIGGVGLAGGYLNQPEFTAHKFEDFSLTGRIYKTGDLGRWLEGGHIEFLGRMDRQIKIRGLRIELGEIEGQLLMQPGVTRGIVMARGGDDRPRYLCAYIVGTAGPGVVRKGLARRLPDYMVPAFIVPLETIPVSPTGKVDHRALPDPVALQEGNFIAPADPLQERLVGLWAEVLGLEKTTISIDANFFQLGGHSLKAAQLTGLIHRRMGLDLPLVEIFKNPSVRLLALALAAAERAAVATGAVEPVEEMEYYPTSYHQKRLWILDRRNPGDVSYSIPGRFSLPHAVDEGRLRHVLRRIVEKHESFRTGFREYRGDPYQYILSAPAVDIPLRVEDISGRPVEGKPGLLEEIFAREALVPFDLDRPPLFRVILVKWDDQRSEIIFNMHHIISDGWSHEIVKRDFARFYGVGGAAHVPERGPQKGLAPLRYRDFAGWHNRRISDPRYREKCRAYWRRCLGGGLHPTQLPHDFGDDEYGVHEGGRERRGEVAGAGYRVRLGRRIKRELQKLARSRNTTLFMVLFASYNWMLAHFSGEEEITGAVIGAGREQAALRDIVGYFVNSIVVSHRVDTEESFEEFLGRLDRDMVEALECQGYPLELVLDELKIPYPRVPVSFNMLNFWDRMPEMPESEMDSGETPVTGPEYIDRISGVKFELSLQVLEYEGGLELNWSYRKNLFRSGTVRWLVEGYSSLLTELAASGD